MTEPLDDRLREILDEVAAEAEKHDCIAAMYIFGSIARGDHTLESDLDIAVEYVDPTSAPSNEWTDSYTRWHETSVDWALALEGRVGHKVALHRMRHPFEPKEDAAWPAILEARKYPVACKGKAIVVRTPRTPSVNLQPSTSV